MKKIGLILVLVMLLETMPAFAAQKPADAVLSESFENYITGAFPSSFTKSGAVNAYTAETGKADKALCIVKGADHGGVIQTDFESVSGRYVFSVKIKLDGAFSGGIRLGGNETEKPVKIENNIIYTGAGKRYGELKTGKWTKIDIVFCESEDKTGSYDVYVDGREALRRWTFENKKFYSPSSVQIYTMRTNSDVNVLIDDLRVYEGDKIRGDAEFAKKEFNTKSVDFVPQDFATGNSVMLKEDFELDSIAAVSLAFTGTGNKELVYDEQRGSKCLYVNDTSGGKYNLFVNQKGIASKQRTVYQTDVCLKAYTGSTQLFMFKYDGDSKFVYTASINEKGGGVLALYDGTFIATLKKDEWYTIAAAYDYVAKTFDFYLNGRLAAENVPFSDEDFHDATSSRLLYWNLTQKTRILCDNVFVYEGEKPYNIAEPEDGSAGTGTGNAFGEAADYELSGAWTDNSVARNLLTGTAAFGCTSGSVFVNGEKSYPELHGFIENDTLYVPLRTVADTIGAELFYDPATGMINAAGVSLADNMSEVSVGGKTVSLASPVIIRGGSTYVPAELIGRDRLFSVDCVTTEGGTCIVGGSGYRANDLIEINRYMTGRRPEAADIKSDYEQYGKAGVHPRLFVDDAKLTELKQSAQTDPQRKKWYARYVQKADGYLAKDTVKYDSTNRLNLANETSARVQALGLVYRMTGDTRYSEKGIREMKAITEWPLWDDGLCLGTASFALSLGYDWFYNAMSAADRKYFEEVMRGRVLQAYAEAYANPGWAKLNSNWNFVSNCGGVTSALVLTDVYPAECFVLLANAARSLEYGLEVFAPDGQWYEGPAYWSYAMEFFVETLMAYESVLGTDYDLTKYRGVDKTEDYIIQMQGPAGSYNYSDTINAAFTNMPGIFYTASKFSRPDWSTARLQQLDELDYDVFLTDFIAYTPDMADAQMPNDAYFRSPEFGDIAVQRGSYADKSSIYLAYKGGKAEVSHGQQDAGSFILDLGGVRWAEELGREPYSVPGYNTMGVSRWGFYKTRAEGHNTIVINPDSDHARNLYGEGWFEKNEFAPTGGFSIINLDEPYNNKALSYRRGYMLGDGRRSVTIRDEISLKDKSDVYWFMHTKAEMTVDGNRVILTQGNEKLYMDCVIEGAAAEIYESPARPFPTSPDPVGQNKNVDLRKVTIKASGAGKICITVKLYDAEDAAAVSEISTAELNSWTAPEGELTEKPRLDAIMINGKPSDKFSPEGGSFTYTYDYDEPYPEVTPVGQPGLKTEITTTNVGEGKDMVRIKIYKDGDEQNYRRYGVVLKRIPYLRANLDGFTRYETITVKPSSDNYDKNFPPQNLSDASLDTRFAIQGIGVDVADIDLGGVEEIDAVALGFYDALARAYDYEILASEDGVNFTSLYRGQSTSLTTDYEIVKTEPVKARYLRYKGYGNSINDWNNITEFSALKRQPEGGQK